MERGASSRLVCWRVQSVASFPSSASGGSSSGDGDGVGRLPGLVLRAVAARRLRDVPARAGRAPRLRVLVSTLGIGAPLRGWGIGRFRSLAPVGWSSGLRCVLTVAGWAAAEPHTTLRRRRESTLVRQGRRAGANGMECPPRTPGRGKYHGMACHIMPCPPGTPGRANCHVLYCNARQCHVMSCPPGTPGRANCHVL